MPAEESPTSTRPNWRDSESYAYTRGLTRESWAWEFLRRNPDHAKMKADLANASLQILQRNPLIVVIDSVDVTDIAQAWGCVFYQVVNHLANIAAVFWCSEVNESVLPVRARPATRKDADRFDLQRLGHPAVVLRSSTGIEHALLSDGTHHIQLEVRRGSLLDGPVHLHYELAGCYGVEAKMLALHRLLALQRLGRFPQSLYPPEQRAHRWIMALRALDAHHASASHREIASELWGDDAVEMDWRGESDYLRSRVRRTIRVGEDLANGGYLRLLRR